MSHEEQVATLLAIIAEQRETIARHKEEIARVTAQSERYSRWWIEADAKLEALENAKTNIKPEAAE